jgi:hypothetical protein
MALTVGALLDFLDGRDRGDRVEINIAGRTCWFTCPATG